MRVKPGPDIYKPYPHKIMGYFSNGNQCSIYLNRYCANCLHMPEGRTCGCAVWDAQMIHNDDESNKPASILNRMIPIDKRGNNIQCRMFVPRPVVQENPYKTKGKRNNTLSKPPEKKQVQ